MAINYWNRTDITTETVLDAVYQNYDPTKPINQYKDSGCFQRIDTTGNEPAAVKPTGETISGKVIYPFLEGKALDPNKPELNEWIYMVVKSIEASLYQGNSYCLFNSSLITDYRDYFKVTSDNDLFDWGDFFKFSLWQIGGTHNGYFDMGGTTGLLDYTAVRGSGSAFKVRPIYWVDKNTSVKYLVGIDWSEAFNSAVNSMAFGANSEFHRDNINRWLAQIVEDSGCTDPATWTSYANRKVGFKKLLGYVWTHCVYDSTKYSSDSSTRLTDEEQATIEANINTYNPSATGSRYKNGWRVYSDASFPGMESTWVWDGASDYVFEPWTVKMVKLLAEKPWLHCMSGELNSEGFPIMDAQETKDIYLKRYFANARCFAFGKLGRLICDYLDMTYGLNFNAKTIEATCGAHEWFMANVDGVFKFFDACPYCIDTTMSTGDKPSLTRPSLVTGHATVQKWGTYNIDPISMIDYDFSSNSNVNYWHVYPYGNFRMTSVPEPLDPDHYIYGAKFKAMWQNATPYSPLFKITGSNNETYYCVITPKLTWHGTEQCYYIGRNSNPYFLIDDYTSDYNGNKTFLDDEYTVDGTDKFAFVFEDFLKGLELTGINENVSIVDIVPVGYVPQGPGPDDPSINPDDDVVSGFLSWAKSKGFEVWLRSGQDYGVQNVSALFHQSYED